ncbi:unannotated protein [freshwater metagenome]|uniref:Unannotated protein n=1 Tax=freshwater metagenome TaxID=449393 RepID=A0A6J7W6R9_9ZZZZ
MSLVLSISAASSALASGEIALVESIESRLLNETDISDAAIASLLSLSRRLVRS